MLIKLWHFFVRTSAAERIKWTRLRQNSLTNSLFKIIQKDAPKNFATKLKKLSKLYPKKCFNSRNEEIP